MTGDSQAQPSPTAPAAAEVSQTLLKMVMADALTLVIDMAGGRERLTGNLHPLATRALFLTTVGVLKNWQLLSLLRPDTARNVVGRDGREARFLRTVGKERGLKVGDLRRHALRMLGSSSIAKADVVRAWTYALIHDSALTAVSEVRASALAAMNKVRASALAAGSVARPAPPEFDVSTLLSDPKLENQVLNRCYELTVEALRQEFDLATEAAKVNRPDSEQRRFLHFASSLVLEAMRMERPAIASCVDLLENVFPEIDRYTFESP